MMGKLICLNIKYCEYYLFGGLNDRLRERPEAEQNKRY